MNVRPDTTLQRLNSFLLLQGPNKENKEEVWVSVYVLDANHKGNSLEMGPNVTILTQWNSGQQWRPNASTPASLHICAGLPAAG